MKNKSYKSNKSYRSYLLLSLVLLVPLVIWTILKAPILRESQTSEDTLTQIKGAKTENRGAYTLVEAEKIPDTRYQIPDTTGAAHQEITISHTVTKGDSLASIAAKYHADSQTIIDYPYNNFGEDLSLTVGQILIIPNGYIDSSKQPTPAPIAKGSGVFAWPTEGQISQYTSWWHSGAIDIAAEAGTAVKAADNGRVVKVEKLSTGYGWHVILDHEDSLTSLYAHMSQIKVEVGQTVSKGDLLGSIGSTGRSTGPHLHFEVKKNGLPIDPMELLPEK